MRRTPYRRVSSVVLALGGLTAVLLGAVQPASATGTVAGTVTVSAGGSLTVRADASSRSAKVGALANRAKVSIACQVTGEQVAGRVRKTDRWDRLADGRYVSDAYITRPARTKVLICPPPPPTPPALSPTDPLLNRELNAGEWVRPVAKITTIGGFRTTARPNHDGVDIGQARNTPIRSVAAGTVVTVRCNTSGPSCDVDGSPAVSGCGWYVQVRHADDIVTRYCHLVRRPEVAVGHKVVKGQTIGYVGTSGHSSGPHLHFEVHLGHPAGRANAVDPVVFMRRAGAPLI